MKLAFCFIIACFAGFIACAPLSALEGTLSTGEDVALEETQDTSDKAVSDEASDKPCVELLDYSGNVKVCQGSGTFGSPETGMVLEAGDRIKTGDSSYAELSFDAEDKNVVRIESNSDLALVMGENEKLELMNGEVYCILDNLPRNSSFEVRTPTAVAGVRGTDWRVEADAENTVVEAFTNDAYVKSIGSDGAVSKEKTVIAKGFMTNVKRFAPPAQLQAISEERIGKFRDMKINVANRAQEIRKIRKPPARMLRRGGFGSERSGGQSSGNTGVRPGLRQNEKGGFESQYKNMKEVELIKNAEGQKGAASQGLDTGKKQPKGLGLGKGIKKEMQPSVEGTTGKGALSSNNKQGAVKSKQGVKKVLRPAPRVGR